MEKKSLRPSRKPNKSGNRGMKNAGFIALLILFALVVFAAANQPNNLKQISSTAAIADANAGKYKEIIVTGNELQITEKGKDKPTLKSFSDPNSSLKEQGLDTKKVSVSYKPQASGSDP